MRFRLVPKSVTLNDLEQCNNHSRVAAVHLFGLSWAMIIREIISQCATCILLCNNRVMVFIDELFVSIWVFTALHVMQTRYCDENSVHPSVCPSVRLSHA